MAGKAVHYVVELSGDSYLFASIDYACGRSDYTNSKTKMSFTNHKPDVSCKQCLKAMEDKDGTDKA